MKECKCEHYSSTETIQRLSSNNDTSISINNKINNNRNDNLKVVIMIIDHKMIMWYNNSRNHSNVMVIINVA